MPHRPGVNGAPDVNRRLRAAAVLWSGAAISAVRGPMMILRNFLDWIDQVVVLLITAALRVAGGYVLTAGALLAMLIVAWLALRRSAARRAERL